MRVDGKAPAPPWLRGVEEMEARLAHLEGLVAHLVADAAKAPEKKAVAKEIDPPKAAPKKAVKRVAKKK
jgi:hypothetical protein